MRKTIVASAILMSCSISFCLAKTLKLIDDSYKNKILNDATDIKTINESSNPKYKDDVANYKKYEQDYQQKAKTQFFASTSERLAQQALTDFIKEQQDNIKNFQDPKSKSEEQNNGSLNFRERFVNTFF